MSEHGPKIISSGQTGVGRGALDAALDTGTPCGGYCPQGRRAEDGDIPGHYPLTESGSADYEDSMRDNVTGSDGTLIIHFGGMRGDAELAERFCRAHSKPHLAIDGKQLDIEKAEQQLFDFLRKYSIHILHVAGARRSEHAGAYDYTHKLLVRLLRR
ncbi:MAG: hypothetical protein EP312_07395 [Gammaproteobacteria bacterium]|nr:MAG: hypothetical protein EP312_07395 [Gammaproteobacteria bacterium]